MLGWLWESYWVLWINFVKFWGLLLLGVEGFFGLVFGGKVLVGVWEGWVYIRVYRCLGVVEGGVLEGEGDCCGYEVGIGDIGEDI